MMDNLQIMDVTLRDGSYLIDFQFTTEDTAFLCMALEKIGLNWIEIGHGVGLGGSKKGYGVAAASDEEYLETASSNIKNAKWGMFFIPNIGTIADIDIAAKYKMPFIRIGSDISNIAQTQKYIEHAKSHNMIVTFNAMKSYVASPKEFAKAAYQMQKWGVDIMYLVDSAGGLLPNHIEDYFHACKQETSINLGFHAHDNLCMAMANTLKAIECGAYIVDASLQGMGRSAGNTILEVLLAILKQKNLFPYVNLNELMDLSDKFIKPISKNKILDTMAITAGYARFHSSYTNKLKEYATKFQIDTRDLIVRLCEEDQSNAPEFLLEKLGKELFLAKKLSVDKITINNSKIINELKPANKIDALIKELKSMSSKLSKLSVINLVFHKNPINVSSNIHSSESFVIGSIAIDTLEAVEQYLLTIDGKIDILFLDIDRENKGFARIENFKKYFPNLILLTYSDIDIWVNSVVEQIIRRSNENLYEKKIAVIGQTSKSKLFENKIIELGGVISDDINQSDYIIFWSNEYPNELFKKATIKSETIIIDAQIGSLDKNSVEYFSKNTIVRVDIWASLVGSLTASYQSFKTIKYSFGSKKIQDINIVSGGFIGKKGDVVVDNVNQIEKIIGIADGVGGIKYDFDENDLDKIKIIKSQIHSQFINNII